MRRRIAPVVLLMCGALVSSGIAAGVAVAGPDQPRDAEAAGPAAGPALLHAPPPPAPQLENTGIWEARPTQVCHSSAYRDGEYLHQGCIYDDQGGGIQYRWFFDTLQRNYVYPDDPVYRRNAADIVEVRTKPLPDATAFRITMNTMVDPEVVGITLALGDSDEPRPVPHGANTVMPAAKFVTVHGSDGDIVDAATGKALPDRPSVEVDVPRRQIEVRVPHSAFDPTGNTKVRLGAAAGLWDRDKNRYLVPQAISGATHPGGAVITDTTPSAFLDSAFRFHEPAEAPYLDAQQKRAIAEGDLSPFSAEVDFSKLAAGKTDDSGIPTTGYITRIYASHFEKAQGRRLPSDPGGPPPGSGTQQGGLQTGAGEGSEGRVSLQFGWPCRDDCVPDLPGRLQRYSVYPPEQAAPKQGYPSLVWINGYALRPGDDVAGPSDLYQQFANRSDHPTMVIDVDARGNDEWFYGESGASVFEALADARRHYPLDPDRTAMGGFSSGAYGANKLSLTFPDVFGRAFICDGLDVAPSFPGLNGIADALPIDTVTAHEAGSKLTPMLPNRRNQPVMEWAGTTDDFIPYNITRERGNAYAAGDYDYEFVSWTLLAAEHLTMCKNGMWGVATDWMGDGRRAVDPHHVTYVRNPLMDDPASGLVGDHAYWLSGIESRDGRLGKVDVVSRGQGVQDAPVPGKQTALGNSGGSVVPLNPYVREFRHLKPPVPAEQENALDIEASNIGAVTIDPKRAGVECDAELRVRTDGPVTVTLLGCDRSQHFAGNGGPPPPATYDPPDPLAAVRPPDGLPLPAELGNVPQLPLHPLPPVRIPPNVAEPPLDLGRHELPALPF